MKTFVILIVVAVVAAFAAPFATSHATVSLLQPQGRALTAASVTYILRVPNEKSAQSTYSVIMTVPEAVQQSISVKQTADWTITLQRRDTGEKNAAGEAIMATAKITWRSKPGNADPAGLLRRVPVPDAEPGDPAAGLLRGRPVVQRQAAGWEVRARQLVRRLRRAQPRPRASKSSPASRGRRGGGRPLGTRRRAGPRARQAVGLPAGRLAALHADRAERTRRPDGRGRPKIPAGVEYVVVENTPGWTARVVRANGRIDVIRFTGSIAPDFFASFRLIARNPVEEGELVWAVTQRYAGRRGGRLDRAAGLRHACAAHSDHRVGAGDRRPRRRRGIHRRRLPAPRPPRPRPRRRRRRPEPRGGSRERRRGKRHASDRRVDGSHCWSRLTALAVALRARASGPRPRRPLGSHSCTCALSACAASSRSRTRSS